MNKSQLGLSLLTLGFLSAFSNPLSAKNPVEGTLIYNSVKSQCKTHDIGNLWYTITNWGMYGSGDEYFCPGSPNAEWPAGSDVEYLFIGCIWIGAQINNDTLLTGCRFTDELKSEMLPGNAPGDTIVEAQNVSDQDYIAVYWDTFDIFPSHTPLGIEIRQKSYAWTNTDFDDFIIFDYTVQNVGTFNLQDLFVGIFLETDIGPNTGVRYEDDLSGFIDTLSTGDTVNIAWSKDDDGDGGLTPGWIGMKILCEEDLQVAFNWWVSDTGSCDFGPVDPGNPNDIGRTPRGDVEKYRVMSNGYIDPNQEDTPPPCPTAPPAGADTRFLFSFGPFQHLPPGDSISFTFVIGVENGFDGLVNTLLNAEELCGAVGVEEDSIFGVRSTEFVLKQNYPNPFNKLTTISYQLKAPSHTTLNIYDLSGRLVKTLVDAHQKSGIYQVEWDGSSPVSVVRSGIYFYRLVSGDFIDTKKLILLR
jgi:hypothetical protein